MTFNRVFTHNHTFIQNGDNINTPSIIVNQWIHGAVRFNVLCARNTVQTVKIRQVSSQNYYLK